jgi:hydrogenase maturation protein HypF
LGYRLIVSGIVQGVGFRPFIYRLAKSLGLNGYIKNLGDAGVEIYLQTSKNKVNIFITRMKSEKPPLAVIERIKTVSDTNQKNYSDFNIFKSSNEKTNLTSIIPPDVSICDECFKELYDDLNRRKNYFFITCTNCGPRFSTITNLPYDRPQTTLVDFPMCEKCRLEYTNPNDRRFHAQTIACLECGPKVYLVDNNGNLINETNPIEQTTKLLEEGYIVGVKGNSGFHFATSVLKSEPIIRLREEKKRPTKPFAIMAPDIENIRRFALLSEYEKKLLTSYIKPVILLSKSEEYFLSDEISPGLHNIGVMLPYTGTHHLLFKNSKEPAYVMTSANPQDEPIAIENGDAIRKLGRFVDYFLLHNRRINQRSDDSVIRFHGQNAILIRRSRGYVPKPIDLDWLQNKDLKILGCGGEENVTFCILKGKKAILSQYIGKVQKYETFKFYQNSIEYFKKILNIEFQNIVCDLHRGFNTTIYAKNLSEKYNLPLRMIPHHYAHLAGLMGENNLEPMIGIIVDGFGLGEDGKAWGGEITTFKRNKFIRIGSLEEFYIPGGDLATIYPLRIAMGFLYETSGYKDWIIKYKDRFPYGLSEIKIINKIINDKKSLTTSSAGRYLDAISAILGLCFKRTYDGEPAIKLESFGRRGKDVFNIDPQIKDNKLLISDIVKKIYYQRNNYKLKDLAFSAMNYLAKGLAELAVESSNKMGIDRIGISGGVAFNETIVNIIREKIEKNGFNLIEHKLTPPGDGGVSFGQIISEILISNKNNSG